MISVETRDGQLRIGLSRRATLPAPERSAEKNGPRNDGNRSDGNRNDGPRRNDRGGRPPRGEGRRNNGRGRPPRGDNRRGSGPRNERGGPPRGDKSDARKPVQSLGTIGDMLRAKLLEREFKDKE